MTKNNGIKSVSGIGRVLFRTMGLLVAGLGSFLMETRTAARRNLERMRERRDSVAS